MKKPEPKEYPVQPKGWRNKYKCHKNKGDHSLVLTHAYYWNLWQPKTIFEDYVCTACAKKVYKSEPW
jgi:hypothetical protein